MNTEGYKREENDVPRGTSETLSLYCKEIMRWNKAINLVSKQDSISIESIMERHILDSLQIIHLIDKNDSVIDIGSGAGFPGLVLAASGIADTTLIEPDYKKASFLRHVSTKLQIKCTIKQIKSEHYIHYKAAHIITSRAFSSIKNITSLSKQNISHNTKLILFKSIEQLDKELKEFSMLYRFNLQLLKSQVNTESNIVILSKIKLI